jgi:hypothetical protein
VVRESVERMERATGDPAEQAAAHQAFHLSLVALAG